MMEFYDKKLYEIMDVVPSYVNLREKLNCPDEKKGKVMDYVVENGEGAFKTTPETIDGVRFSLEDGWILIRPSGTEPYVRIRVEAKNNKFAKELLEKGMNLVKKALINK